MLVRVCRFLKTIRNELQETACAHARVPGDNSQPCAGLFLHAPASGGRNAATPLDGPHCRSTNARGRGRATVTGHSSVGKSSFAEKAWQFGRIRRTPTDLVPLGRGQCSERPLRTLWQALWRRAAKMKAGRVRIGAMRPAGAFSARRRPSAGRKACPKNRLRLTGGKCFYSVGAPKASVLA